MLRIAIAAALLSSQAVATPMCENAERAHNGVSVAHAGIERLLLECAAKTTRECQTVREVAEQYLSTDALFSATYVKREACES